MGLGIRHPTGVRGAGALRAAAGTAPHADADAYWKRRSEYHEADLARLFLSSAKVSDWLVDTGFADGVADLGTMRDLTAGRIHEIVRLESVAEEAARAPGDYAAAFDADPGRAGGDRDSDQVDPGLPRRLRGRSVRALAVRGGAGGRRWRDSGESA